MLYWHHKFQRLISDVSVICLDSIKMPDRTMANCYVTSEGLYIGSSWLIVCVWLSVIFAWMDCLLQFIIPRLCIITIFFNTGITLFMANCLLTFICYLLSLSIICLVLTRCSIDN